MSMLLTQHRRSLSTGFLTIAAIGERSQGPSFPLDVIFCVSKKKPMNVLSLRFMIDHGYAHIPRKGLFKELGGEKNIWASDSIPVLTTINVSP